MSVPICSGPKQAAPAAPAPDDDPPGVRWGFHGLRVTPKDTESVAPHTQNSGVVVIATGTAPAGRRWP